MVASLLALPTDDCHFVAPRKFRAAPQATDGLTRVSAMLQLKRSRAVCTVAFLLASTAHDACVLSKHPRAPSARECRAPQSFPQGRRRLVNAHLEFEARALGALVMALCAEQ
jgi:site-specific DNA-cytosine methylase